MTEEKHNDNRPRYVSLDGCEMIGEGKHGRVYLLNDEQIIKVYYDGTASDQIELERRNGRSAFIQGVPSCITFDLVETDLGEGIVFELAGGKPLGTYISEHPEELEINAEKIADLITDLHRAKASPSEFDSAKNFYTESYRSIPEKYLSLREVEKLIRIINAVPDCDCFIHTDLHTQNIMINDKKELMLIDMAEITSGHPIFDLGSTYMTMVFSPKLSSKLGREITGLSKKQAKRVWDIVIRRYCKTEDKDKIARIERLCRYMCYMRLATLIARTSVFSKAAYMLCALWAKVFVLSQAERYMHAFSSLATPE